MTLPALAPLPLLCALALAVVHLFSGKLRFLQVIPRSRWLSAASGVSVAYVFVHLLPELSDAEQKIARAVGPGLAFAEHHVYLVALVGLAVFYGLERLTQRSREQQRALVGKDETSAGVFWLHMASFSVYNGLIGYLLLHREKPGLVSLLLFAGAMGLHFVVNDYGLREQHKGAYTRIGRWVLAAAILAGWLIGRLTTISDAPLADLLAFLAGGVVLNVLKEELPAERESRFWAFAVGVAAYTALLLEI